MPTHPYVRLFPNKTVAPTVNDDETSTPPHEVGDLWIRVTGEIYQCTDATDGAAVWSEGGGDSFDLSAAMAAATDEDDPADADVYVVRRNADGVLLKHRWDNLKSRVHNYLIPIFASLLHDHDGDYLAYESYSIRSCWLDLGHGTYTRTGNHQFTVSGVGDQTGAYRKKTKIKFSQSGTKYGVVLSSSYAAPVTTINLVPNSDYTMTANPSNLWVSYDDLPEGFPYEFSYSPTLNNMTLGNGTLTAKWSTHPGGMHVHFEFLLGSTSTVGTTPWFTLPANQVGYGGSFEGIGIAMYFDNAGVSYNGQVAFVTTGGAYFLAFATAGAYATQAGLTATVPFTWGAGDYMQGECLYFW